MAKVIRYNIDDYEYDVGEKMEKRFFHLLGNNFREALVLRFLEVKDLIEDWTDPITYENQLKNRLKNIADNTVYTENDLIDMALISIILWNIEEV